MRSFLTRSLPLDVGINRFALSAEHMIVGVERPTFPRSGVDMVVAENTALTNHEEGLVYRSAYVAYVGEQVPLNILNVLGHLYLPTDGQAQPMVVYILPADRR